MNKPVIDKERGPREAPCPRCGADAEWSFVNPEAKTVEVVCPDCGRVEMSREEFDLAQTEIAGPEETL
jgi:predicted RNA-binding Zn-ribbon protein involved in translation (DUF1610 family)